MTRRLLLFIIVTFLFAGTLFARIGGGESYSDDSSSSDSSSDDSSSSYDSSDSSDYDRDSSDYSSSSRSGGGATSAEADAVFDLVYGFFQFLYTLTVEKPLIGVPVDLMLVLGFVGFLRRRPQRTRVLSVTSGEVAKRSPGIGELRSLDPNFSEAVFTDFCYSLFARVHHARGQGKIDQFALYLSENARASLTKLNAGWVGGIIVGGFKIVNVNFQGTLVEVVVEYEANYTEMDAQAMQRWYVRERWTLQRGRDVLSPTPEHAKAEHCPACGAALQTRSDGACTYCGAKIDWRQFDWYVRSINVAERSPKSPNLISHAPERGTDKTTRFQHGFAGLWSAFQSTHAGFDPGAFEQRVRLIARELQDAWTSRDWERARAFETDALFQMHRYWIDEYKRQKVKNVVDDFTVTKVEPVKIVRDAFFDAITVRIHANGRDYTTDESGQTLSGSSDSVRVWTEYWTLIRGRGVTRATTTTATCPNCNAALKISETGICTFCNGKITSGEFDWVLSRIEQDESYEG